MSDVERLIREALLRHEAEVPPPDPLEARPVAVRARRRQVLNVLGAGVLVALIALGAAGGIGALLRADIQRPAVDPISGPFAKARGWIAFRSGPDIVAVDPADPESTAVLGPSQGDDPIAWSSDGTKLLLRPGPEDPFGLPCTVPCSTVGLLVLHSEGSRTTLVRVTTGRVPLPTWGSFSPDGTEVVYGAGRSAGPYIIDADGGEPRLLGGDRCHVEVNGVVVDTCGEGTDAAAWSPDGSKILWLDFIEGGGPTKPYEEDCPITDCGHRAVLSSVNPDGTGIELGVAPLPGEGVSSVVWSPDGSRLAFWLADDDDLNAQIFVINPDGSGLRQITDAGDNRWPAWSPDGSRIAFVRNGVLHTMAPDGSDLQEVVGVTPDGAIAWNPVDHADGS
jgi:WD40-like Beta Propeller Repeat